MTQRSLGREAGIMAAKSCFKLEKWLKPVNRNMIARAMRPASLQEESRLRPSAPKPRRTMNEMTKTNREIMCLLSAGAGHLPAVYGGGGAAEQRARGAQLRPSPAGR